MCLQPSFQSILNVDCRFLVYNHIFSDHTIDITSHEDQSPIKGPTEAYPELQEEIKAWVSNRKLCQLNLFGQFVLENTAFTYQIRDEHQLHPLFQDGMMIISVREARVLRVNIGNRLYRPDLSVYNLLWKLMKEAEGTTIAEKLRLEIVLSEKQASLWQSAADEAKSVHKCRHNCTEYKITCCFLRESRDLTLGDGSKLVFGLQRCMDNIYQRL